MIVYVPRIDAGGSLEIPYEMTARYPLRALAAPSQVYAYYQPEVHAAARPALVEVVHESRRN